MFIGKCRYRKVCKHHRKNSAACNNIETNQDEYECGIYRAFIENRPGSIGV